MRWGSQGANIGDDELCDKEEKKARKRKRDRAEKQEENGIREDIRAIVYTVGREQTRLGSCTGHAVTTTVINERPLASIISRAS